MSTIRSFGDTPFPRLAAVAPPDLLAPAKMQWPERILVCAHDSSSTGDALTAAKALAGRCNAEVNVLTVFAPRIPLPNVPGKRGSAQCESRDRSAAADLIRAVRAEERRRFDGHVAWPIHLEVGNPVQMIIENTRSTRADLVIVGLGRHDPLVRQAAVAIPVSLARYTDVPMLAAAPASRELPQEVVLFVDREPAEPAMIRAALRCIEDAAFVWVLIYTGTRARSGDGAKHDKDTIASITKTVRREAAAVSKQIVVRAVCRAGDPTDAISTLAHDVNADLIVAPAHGNAGTVRSLVPNVADRLLLTAPCSVLIVPAP
jgi:nucleotide-binding universal stress UspA family protein